MGRPSTFTSDIASRICDQLAAGNSLRAICRQDGMPPEATVRRWVIEDVEGFSAQYARARDMGLDSMADEIIAIADTQEIGTKSVSKATGVEITEGDMVEHRRLRVDARKWYLSKVAPKKYGEKVALTDGDGKPLQGGAPVVPVINVTVKKK